MDMAQAAAWEAGKVTLRYFQTKVTIELKSDQTPVTAADREAEELLCNFLGREFPGDAFLGEERGDRPGTSGWRWIIDPIDGTKSFIQGVPLYGVMVGLEDPRGEAVVGAISFSPLGDLGAAAKGDGCRWNGRRGPDSADSRLNAAAAADQSRKTSLTAPFGP